MVGSQGEMKGALATWQLATRLANEYLATWQLGNLATGKDIPGKETGEGTLDNGEGQGGGHIAVHQDAGSSLPSGDLGHSFIIT